MSLGGIERHIARKSIGTKHIDHDLRVIHVRIGRFLRDESALAITEYGLLLAFVAFVFIAVVLVLGNNLTAWFAAKTNSVTTN